MKNLYKILFILILFLTPNVVYAGTNATEQRHIFMVEKFNIVNSVIEISGYSFQSHRDNYGYEYGDNGKLIGNLQNYIIVYTGTWNDSYTDISTCNNAKECYAIKTTVEKRDLWHARCTDKACFDETNVKNLRLKNGFVNTTQCTYTSKNPGGSGTGTHCLYYNVGFSASINLKKIANKFGGNETYNGDIKFKIIPYIKNIAQCAEGEYVGDGKCRNNLIGNEYKDVKASFSDLSVYKGYCRANGVSCGNGSVTSGDYTFEISDLSSTVWFDATIVWARNSEGNPARNEFDEKLGYFKHNEIYEVLDIQTYKQYTKFYDNIKTGTYEDSLLLLRSNMTYGKCPGYENAQGKYCVRPSNTNTKEQSYWAQPNYVKFQGALVIKGFTPTAIKMDCSNINSFSTSSTEKTSNTVNCGNSGSYNQCKKTENIEATIYLKSDSSCQKFKSKKGNNYYIPITVTTDILINQKGTFEFGKITPTSLVAGRGFNLGKTLYNNTITWLIANRTASGQPYYRYDGKEMTVSGDSCVENSNFSVSEDKDYYIQTESGGISEESYNLKTASYLAIEKAVINNKNLIDTSVIDNINFKSCDSNDSKGCNINNANKLVDNGNWESTLTKNSAVNLSFNNKNGTITLGGDDISTRFGGQLINEYSYTLPYSYVTNDANGKVIYFNKKPNLDENDYVDGKNKYFVDLKYTYDNPNGNDFPFNLNTSNPSFVSTMDWSLKGTCGIEVKDGYWIDDDDDNDDEPDTFLINYRPISLDNPFPKANADYSNIAINWRDWYKTRDNQLRIKNTYDNNPLYEIIISYNGRAGTTKISEINAIDKLYTDISGIDIDGQSDFVIKYFTERAIAKESFCKLGKISPNCDGVRGG